MRSVHAFLVASLAVSALAGTGCTKKETLNSDEVTTKGFSLDFKALSNGTTTGVTIAVHIGTYESATYAKLIGGDHLVLTLADGTTAPLSESQEGSGSSTATYYKNSSIAQPEGVLKVDLLRANGDNATDNLVQLPPGFVLSGPTTTASRRSPVTLQWTTKSSQEMEITAKGDCIFDTTKKIIGDPGSYTFNAGDLQSLSGKEKDTCAVTFTVTRTNKTSSGFSAKFGHESRAEGVQIRTLVIQTGE